MINMKKRITLIVLVVFLLSTTAFFSIPSFADTPVIWDGQTPETVTFAGSGTSEDPYQIENAEQLAFFASAIRNNNSDYNDKYFKLVKDLYLNDISAYDNWETTAPANNWKPIGDGSCGLHGVFDGDGHTIYGMYQNSTERCTGLFACAKGTTDQHAVIKNLKIESSMIVSQTSDSNFRIGGLVGIADYLDIENCIVDAKITVTVSNIAESGIGGLIGRGDNVLSIKKSAFVGSITVNESGQGPDRIGGIVGISKGLTLEESYFAGTIKASGTGNDVGGLVGYVNSGVESIQNCYAAGIIILSTDTGSFGGLFGTVRNAESVSNLVQNVSVTKNNDSTNIGAICGNGTLTNTNCFFSTDSGLTDSTAGVTGLSKANMISENMTALSSVVWNAENGKFPILKNAPQIAGKTTGPVEQATLYQLIIHYVDEKDKTIAEDFVALLAAGEKYTQTSPTCLLHSTTDQIVEGTMPEKDLEITVHYTLDQYHLTINYVDEDGNELAAPYQATVDAGTVQKVDSPVIEGYTTSHPSVEVEVKFDRTISVTYKKDPATENNTEKETEIQKEGTETKGNENTTSSGCGSTLGISLIGMISLSGISILTRKRKDEQ